MAKSNVVALITAVCLYSAPAESVEVRLACELQSTVTYSSGNKVQENGSAIVDISRDSKFGTQLTMRSADFETIAIVLFSEKPIPPILNAVSDASDETKWEMMSKTQNDVLKSTKNVFIDRINGTLVYTDSVQFTDGSLALTKARGSCVRSKLK